MRYNRLWKHNRNVARTSRLRMLPGVSLHMAWAVRCAHEPHLVEEGDKTGKPMAEMYSNLFGTLPCGFLWAWRPSPHENASIQPIASSTLWSIRHCSSGPYPCPVSRTRRIQPQYPCCASLRASSRARSKLANGGPEYSG